MGETKEYPIKVVEVGEGIVTVMLKGLGFSGKEEKRLAVPKAQIPSRIQEKMREGEVDFTVTTATPYNLHTWEWVGEKEKEGHPDFTGEVEIVLERIDDDSIAHLRIFHDRHVVIHDYPCSLQDVPIQVTSGQRYRVFIPLGMAGDPKYWLYQGTVKADPLVSNVAETGEKRTNCLAALRKDIAEIEEFIQDQLLYLTRTYRISVDAVETRAIKDEGEEVTRYAVFLEVDL